MCSIVYTKRVFFLFCLLNRFNVPSILFLNILSVHEVLLLHPPKQSPKFCCFFFFFLLFLCSSFRIFFFFLVDGTHRNFRIYFGTMYKNQMKILTRERERERKKLSKLFCFDLNIKKEKNSLNSCRLFLLCCRNFCRFPFRKEFFFWIFSYLKQKGKFPQLIVHPFCLCYPGGSKTRRKKKIISSWSICSPWWFFSPPLPISLSLHLLVFLIRPPPIIVSVMSPHLVRFNYLHRLFPRFFFFVRCCRRLID